MNTPEWIKYDGSDKQIEALASVKTMIRVRYVNGQEVNWSYTLFKSKDDAKALLETAIAYLICQPHPYADVIKIWADTGCPVWVRYEYRLSVGPGSETYVTDEPDFNIPGARYKLTPFEPFED